MPNINYHDQLLNPLVHINSCLEHDLCSYLNKLAGSSMQKMKGTIWVSLHTWGFDSCLILNHKPMLEPSEDIQKQRLAFLCHPLTKAERFCQKFGNFSTIIGLCVHNVSSEIMFPESKNIHYQAFNLVPIHSRLYTVKRSWKLFWVCFNLSYRFSSRNSAQTHM